MDIPETLDAYQSQFAVVETTISLAVPANPTVCQANPRRVGLVISSPQGNAFNISTLPNVTTTTGIAVTNSFGLIRFDVRHDPGLVAVQWFAAAGGFATTLTVIEIILR